MKSSGGQGIRKPPCTQSSLEVLLLVFRGMPCGERCLPTLGEPRRKKYPCVNRGKTCRSLFLALERKRLPFPFLLTSCQELSAFSSTFPARSAFSRASRPDALTEAGVKGLGEKFGFCCSPPCCCLGSGSTWPPQPAAQEGRGTREEPFL